MNQLRSQNRERFFTLLVTLFLLVSFFFGLLGSVRNVAGTPSTPRLMKEKSFYLQTLNETRNVGPMTTQHVMDSIIGNTGDAITSNMRIVARWFLFPELANVLHLEGNVTLILWYKAQGTLDGAIWELTLNELDNEGNMLPIQLATRDLSSDPSILTETSIETSINYTLQPGSTLEAHINIKGNSATNYTIAWGNLTYNSRIVLPTRNYIRIIPPEEGGIWTLNSEYEAQSNFDPDAANKTGYIQVKVTDPFGGYDINWVNITVEAPDGTVIPGLNNVSASKIFGYFNSFESVFQVVFNYSGFSEGRYNITVYALDNNGYLSFVNTGSFGVHLEVDESGLFFVGAPPLEVYIRVFDGDGGPLEGATVLALLGEEEQASEVTNSSGYAKVNLASGNYRVEVWWQQTLVGWKGLLADRNWSFEEPFTITVAVYQLSFRTVDIKGMPLEGAAVTIRFPNGNVTDEPFVADEQGIVSLGESPGGDYNVVVVWRGKVVADKIVFINGSATVDVNCLVYYVNFHAEDADGENVENALITVSDPVFGTIVEARLTNVSGGFSSRLPAGSYEVNAKWFGVDVFESGSLAVQNNTDVFLTLSIYTVTIIPIDSKGVRLGDATVTVSSGVFSQSGNTFETGSAALKLPSGNYTAKVNWQDTEVFSGTITVNGAQPTITLNTKVFYLNVQVSDSLGSPLTGVFTTVTGAEEAIGADNTDISGKTEFRLAIGTYTVEASFKTTYYWTPYHDIKTENVNLTSDKSVEIVFASFPLPFYTTVLFYSLTLLGIALATAALLILFKFRGVSK